MIFCELLWINHILAGNVPPERMGEYIGAILGGLGVTGFSFWFFRWYRRKRKKEESSPPKKSDQIKWELEDQLKGLKEQLDRGVITQEEYEQEKGKLLEESE